MKREETGPGPDSNIEKPSRTRKKKAAEALQKIGEQLIGLRESQLEALELPSELREAVAVAGTMRSHGARRRQLQYIGSLMRQVDADELRGRLARIASQAHDEARRFKQVERWRDDLLSGDPGRQQWLLTSYPQLDAQELTRLIQAAGPDKSSEQRRKAARALFRYLRQWVDPL